MPPNTSSNVGPSSENDEAVLQKLKNATNCGRFGGILKKNADKVVGGEAVRENELPWQVAILQGSGVWAGCGALLLSCDPLIVITAAHCVRLLLGVDKIIFP